MRDLFEQKYYPARVGLFYEQSAAIVLYLFETGPEAMIVFLTELAAGNGYDAAFAAALGIPQENAVEEFERGWVKWMKHRYVRDLDSKVDGTTIAEANQSDHAIFLPQVDETATVEAIQNWRIIDPEAPGSFPATRHWEPDAGGLSCKVSGRDGSSIYGIRVNETPPVAISCKVKYIGMDPVGWFGLAQLDAELNDTRVEAVAPFQDREDHTVVCVWADDLAVFVDGKCAGRYPAFQVSGNARDIDYPLALVAYGSVDVQDLKVARIKEFSERKPRRPEKPAVVKDEPKKKEEKEKKKKRKRRPRGRRRPRP
jgi:hypothetical protein